MTRKIDIFVFVATFVIYALGIVLNMRNIGNLYYTAGAFSIVLLAKALFEENFNPGNYLFYCILVMVLGIVVNTIIMRFVYRGASLPVVVILSVVLLCLVSYVSQYQYMASMLPKVIAKEEVK